MASLQCHTELDFGSQETHSPGVAAAAYLILSSEEFPSIFTVDKLSSGVLESHLVSTEYVLKF